MKTIFKACGALAVCAVLLSAANSYAQSASKPARPRQQVDILATAKPGQWVKVKGTPQKDLTFAATKVKFLGGNLPDDEWEVSGKILTIDKQKQIISVLRQRPIKCHAKTEFEDQFDNAITINTLEVGQAIKAEGKFLKDGSFVADKVAEDMIKESEGPSPIEVVGKIEKVDPTTKSIQIMGITFQITDKTKSKLATS